MNPATWAQLQAHGVTEETELRLGFLFYCPSKKRAEELAARLHGVDYRTAMKKSGGFFRAQYVLEGITVPMTTGLEALNDWVHWMVTNGMECKCEFDGWGASV